MYSYTSKEAWEVVSEADRAASRAQGDAEWNALIAAGDVHAAAMWLQANRQKLSNPREADRQWMSLTESS